MNLFYVSMLRSNRWYVLVFLLSCLCQTARPQSWTEVGPGYPTVGVELNIASLIIDDTGNVYAANLYSDSTFGLKVWNGKNWKSVGGEKAYYSGGPGFVWAMALDHQGNLYAGGTPEFYNSPTVAVHKWDGSQWTVLGSPFGSNHPYPPSIHAIKTDLLNNVYVAGDLVNANGYGYVAKWDGKTWSEVGTGSSSLNANGVIMALEIDNVGNLYAGGQFTNKQGRPYVAQWDGKSWSELGKMNDTLVSAPVYTLFADPYGNIYSGGGFPYNLDPGFLVKWNGKNWEKQGDLPVNGAVLSIIGDTSGNIYAGGTFLNAEGYGKVHKWDGSIWSTVGGPLSPLGNNQQISALALSCSGTLYAAGAIVDTNYNFYVAQFPLSAGTCLPPGCASTYTFSYPDTLTVCKGDSQQLSVTSNTTRISWYKDGSLFKQYTPSLSASKFGYYKAQVLNCNGISKFTDSVYINIVDKPLVSLGADTSFCEGRLTPFILRAATGYTKYFWNQKESELNTFEAYMGGAYELTVVNANGCVGSDTLVLHNHCSPFVIPNLITPNNDEKNEVFMVVNLLPLSSLHIYNSWGENVYESLDYNNSWGGENLTDGIYFYRLENKYLKQSWKGWVQILR